MGNWIKASRTINTVPDNYVSAKVTFLQLRDYIAFSLQIHLYTVRMIDHYLESIKPLLFLVYLT